MSIFEISPESITAELTDFQTKLVAGISNLATMGELPAGATAHDVVFDCGKLRLLHYRSDASIKQNETPLLIVYSLINRYYILDLQQNRSTVQGLLEAGQDVYMIDWGYPDADDRFTTLDDYLNGALDACVDEICRRHAISQLNMLGICQGGVFSLCYSALHSKKIRNLVTVVTPIDFHTPDNILGHWSKNIDVDYLVDTLGNISGNMVSGLFMSMKPHQAARKYRKCVDFMDDVVPLINFMKIEKWIHDSPDQAGETFRQFLKDIVQKNKLVTGQLVIGEKAVDLKKITVPILNIYAEQDHLVPPASAKALGGLTGTQDYSERSFNSGHVGPFISARAQEIIPPAIAQWLDQR
jgi:polyhydroxyalkanoate synthase